MGAKRRREILLGWGRWKDSGLGGGRGLGGQCWAVQEDKRQVGAERTGRRGIYIGAFKN